AAGDFNQDGRLDLAYCCKVPGNISILFQAPTASLSTSTLDFGNQDIGSPSASQTVTVTNTGSAELLIKDISISGTNAGDFSHTKTCGTHLAFDVHCSITVVFTPTNSGQRTASVVLTDNASDNPQSVSLSGNGVGSVVTLSPTFLNMPGTLVGTTSPPRTVQLSNVGNVHLNIRS